MTVEKIIDLLMGLISPENAEEENEALGKAAKILQLIAARRWTEGKTMDKISRERVEKVWRGEWEEERFAGELEGWQHTECGRHSTEKSNWCPKCGKAMTDEAVDLIMQRLEALQDETD